MVAFNRVPASLAAKAEGEAGVPDAPDPARFSDDAERELAEAVAEVRGPLLTALDGGDMESCAQRRRRPARPPSTATSTPCW